MLHLIEQSGIAVPLTLVTFDQHIAPWQSSYTTLGERRAEAEFRRGLYHSTYGTLHWIRAGCQYFNVDALLWAYGFSCRVFAITGLIFKRAIEEDPGIPVLSLEADWFDNRTYSTEALRTRVETFAQLLAARKAG